MVMKADVKKRLSLLVTGRVAHDEPMAGHTSIGIGGTADVYCEPATVDELRKVLFLLAENDVPCMPVGNGTNILVRDDGYRGAVVCLSRLQGLVFHDGNGDDVIVSCEAGVSLSRLVDESAERSIGGLAFVAGIPGSVGGAVSMNAGAYGREMKDVISLIRTIDRTGRVGDRMPTSLTFRYRCLELDAGEIVVGADFRLTRGDRQGIEEDIAEIRRLRRGKHPLQYRNAGSVFKNPAWAPAGRIIDELGLKGRRVGDAMVSAEHGNFIVNCGSATAADVIELMTIITETVERERGIHLEPEVRIIGGNG